MDATYGSPDSLLYYAHDSFVCDVSEPESPVHSRLRCKDEYIDIGVDGLWSKYWCAEPHDWRACLSGQSVREIAVFANRIARHVQGCVNVMFFVDVDSATEYPPVLPWVFFPADDTAVDTADSLRHVDANAPLVHNLSGIASLESSIAEGASLSGAPQSVRVRPDPDMIRSDSFAKALVRLAQVYGLAVQLEGSVLSHIYYVLRRQNVRIRCVNPLELTQKERTFDKLVRDGIPDKIERGGEQVATRRVGPTEYELRLRMKLVEESLELASADQDADVMEELADVMEVVRGLLSLRNIALDEVLAAAELKRSTRGGFDRGIVLVGTREPLPSPSRHAQLSLLDGDRHPIAASHAEFTPTAGLPLVARGHTVEVSLVPPLIGAQESTVQLQLGHLRIEARASYGGSSVTLRLRAMDDDSGVIQMRLDDQSLPQP